MRRSRWVGLTATIEAAWRVLWRLWTAASRACRSARSDEWATVPRSDQRDARIRKSLNDSSRAWADFSAEMSLFQSLVQLGREDELQARREAMHDLLDTYLDQYAVAGRLARGAS
jgi:hypothetical protein